MAKKVVATLKKEGGVKYIKVVKAVKSPKSGAYTFQEQVVPEDIAKEMVKK